MQRRHAEDGHDVVAREPLHGAAVGLEGRAHLGEEPRHDPPQRLGVEPLAERRRVDDVGEDDGDGLPHLVRGGGLRERRRTRVTEPRAGRVLLSAVRARGHFARV